MSDTKTESRVVAVKTEINKQLADPETVKSLIDVTFKGFEPALMKRALLEGMMRGFSFKNFLEKDVYAIPYASTYSLVTSIDYSRKIGAKSGIVGVDAPVYTEVDGKIVSCRVTVKKRFPDGYVGEFTAEPDFKEYSTGKNLWSSKPKTMIAKVAEMHALRKACPEELSQAYVEEEIQRETVPAGEVTMTDITPHKEALENAPTIEDLEKIWADMPGPAKTYLRPTLEQAKAKLIKESADVV